MVYRLALPKWGLLDECLKVKNVTYEFKQGSNNGFMYQTGNADGMSKYHIHSIESVLDNNMVFSKLLAKSSNWRGGDEPDLAQIQMSQWVAACTGMDSSVLVVVRALKECFEELGATGPV